MSTQISAGPGPEPGGPRPDPWVLHPFLIVSFPILSLYAHNVYELPIRAMAAPMATALGTTAALWLAFRSRTRDAHRAGLATSLLVALFFGYRSIYQAANATWYYLGDLWVYPQFPAPPSLVIGLEVAAAVGAIAVVFRRRKDHRAWTSRLNAFALILVAIPAAGALVARLREPAGTARVEASAPVSSPIPGRSPDIYYIVLDGYARSDVMKDLYGFDYEPFLRRLEGRGFFVARRSEANYCQTRLSLASSLNGDYLDRLIEPGGRDLLPLSGLIKDNMVIRSLRPRGYKFVTFSTNFEPTDFPEADLFLTPGGTPPDFQRLLVDMTPLRPLLATTRLDDAYQAHRDRTLFLLDQLPSIARVEGPTFTFAHIVSPHPPFVFGEDGEDVSPRATGPIPADSPKFGTVDYLREAYRKQAVYITGQVDRAIDRILEASPEPPIIILQSDHGSWLNYHPDDVDRTDLRERFGVLNCLLIPGRKAEGLADDLAPVNNFPVVLNQAFGAGLPIRENRSYFSTFSDPLVFTDVTERLHSDRERSRRFTPPAKYIGLTK